MPKFLISTVMAAALALSATTAPVMANERTERLIAGAILLGILGAALNETQRRDTTVHQPRVIAPLAPKPAPTRIEPRRARALPAECLRRFQTRNGTVRLFDGSCLERHFRGYRQIPLECAVTIRSQGRFESGFRPRCLRRAGYGLAGH